MSIENAQTLYQALTEDVDTTFDDSASRPDVKQHQQDHDRLRQAGLELTTPGVLETPAGAQARIDARIPDPSGEPDNRWLRTQGGALIYTAAPAGGGGGGATTLDGLTDVDAPAPADLQLLRFDNGSSLWVPVTLTAGDVGAATAAQGALADSAVQPDDLTVVAANIQTASYTLVLADAGKVVEMNVGTANDLTVPPNSSVAFPVGTVIEVYQYGAGATTVVAGAGVTVLSPDTLELDGQYATATLRKRATDEWTLDGRLVAA